MNWYETTHKGIIIRVKIQPRSKETKILGLHGDPPRLKIRIAAPPVDGKANQELLSFLKKQLNITYSDLEIIRGHTSFLKDILCTQVPLEKIINLLYKL